MPNNTIKKLYFRISNPQKEMGYLREINLQNIGLVVNAHTAIDNPKIIEFIRRNEINFIIDPVTYVFSRSLRKLRKNQTEFTIRRTWDKLLNLYGNDFRDLVKSKVINERDLIPRDFLRNNKWDSVLIDNFVSSVIESQKTFIKDKLVMLKELQKRAGFDIPTKDLTPDFLIAPYFYSSKIPDDWFNLTVAMIHSAIKFKGNFNLYGVLCISNKILNDINLDLVINSYRKLDGILIWISDFKEHKIPGTQLAKLVEVISKLRKEKFKIINFYGGYFSLMLTNNFLDSFVCGVNYGESRNIDTTPARGMRKMVYINTIHKHLIVEHAPRIWLSDSSHLCNCKTCVNLCNESSNFNAYNYSESMQKSEINRVQHFLNTRINELENIKSKNLEEITFLLADDIKKSTNIPSDQVIHLRNWKKVIELISIKNNNRVFHN